MPSTFGFVFDWDGVVVDSSDLHEKSWEALAQELDLPLPEGHFKRGFGKRNSIIIPEILGWTQDKKKIRSWSDRKEELYRKFGSSAGIRLIEGIVDFLRRMKESGIGGVIGTSTDRQNLRLAFDEHGIEHFFRGSVCSDDVTHGKPHPEVFLKASELLGLPPQSCVVFEDSPHGIEAACRAGMKAVGISTSQTRETLAGAGARMIVASPKELRVKEVLELFENP